MRHHGGQEMDWPEAAVLDFAERFKPLSTALHDVVFLVADQLFDEEWKTGDGERERTVRKIALHLGCSPSTARYALQAAELGRRLPVDHLGTPSVHQLTVIAWADVKTRGWGQIEGWMKRNGFTFENTSPDELKSYCKQIKKDAKAEERDVEFARTHGDPHDPPDAEVVDDEPVDARSSTPPPNLTEKERAENRKSKALAEIVGLIATAKTVVNHDQIPAGDEELRKHLGDLEHLAELAQHLWAKAMPYTDDAELPL
jgi:hypothetical protein